MLRSPSLFSDAISFPRKWYCLVTLALLFPWGLYSQTSSRYRAMVDHVKELSDKHKKTIYQLRTQGQLMNAFEANKRHLEKSNESLLSDIRQTGFLVDTHADNYETLELREDAMLQRIDDLELHIQANSLYDMKEEYGNGPYQVELRLTSPFRKHIPSDTPIVMELDLFMPHSIHYFLRMAKKDLWKGMTFMPQQTERHRIHASAVDMDSLNRQDYKFKNAKLSNLVFAEETPDSCGAYSVGFIGSPGGPDFYVNGRFVPKNRRKEACFARVISGEGVIDSILDGQNSVIGIESIYFFTKG